MMHEGEATEGNRLLSPSARPFLVGKTTASKRVGITSSRGTGLYVCSLPHRSLPLTSDNHHTFASPAKGSSKAQTPQGLTTVKILLSLLSQRLPKSTQQKNKEKWSSTQVDSKAMRPPLPTFSVRAGRVSLLAVLVWKVRMARSKETCGCVYHVGKLMKPLRYQSLSWPSTPPSAFPACLPPQGNR